MTVMCFEGLDAAGKTSLSKELARAMKLHHFKYSRTQQVQERSESIKYDWPFFVEFLKNVSCDVVIDRGYASEFAYSRVFREPTDIREIDADFALVPNALNVVVFRSAIENEFSLPENKQLENNYELFLSETVAPALVHDNNSSFDESFKQLRENVERWLALEEYNKEVFYKNDIKSEVRLSKLLLPGYFSGNEILFVGQNPGQPHKYDNFEDAQLQESMQWEQVRRDYFIGLKKCRVGGFLEFCKQVGVFCFWQDISFTNILKYSTKSNSILGVGDAELEKNLKILRHHIALLKPTRIVAMGNYASDNLSSLGVEHAVVKHPSHLTTSEIFAEIEKLDKFKNSLL